MRPRPKRRAARGSFQAELERRAADLRARAGRIMLLLEARCGYEVDWSQVEGGRPENADEILAAAGFGAGRAGER